MTLADIVDRAAALEREWRTLPDDAYLAECSAVMLALRAHVLESVDMGEARPEAEAIFDQLFAGWQRGHAVVSQKLKRH